MTDDVSETAASLHILGDDLDPDEISRLLGCEPTSGWRKGEVYTRPNGTRFRAWTGSWSRDVPYRAPGDLDGQIAELLEPLTDDLSVWRDLSERFDMYLYFGIFVRNANQAIGMETTSLVALAERGIRLDFDIYAEVPKDEDTPDDDA